MATIDGTYLDTIVLQLLHAADHWHMLGLGILVAAAEVK